MRARPLCFSTSLAKVAYLSRCVRICTFVLAKQQKSANTHSISEQDMSRGLDLLNLHETKQRLKKE
jgi:hypothetical protein